MEAIRVFFTQIAVNTADGKVHFGQPPGGMVGLLTVYAYIPNVAAMSLDKLFRLYKHAPGAAARVKYPAFIRCQHFNQ